MITVDRPRIQRIRRTNRGLVNRHLISAVESVRLLSVQRHGLPGRADLRVAIADFDYCGVASVVNLDAIIARALQQHGNVRSVYLERLVLTEVAHVHDSGSRSNVEL